MYNLLEAMSYNSVNKIEFLSSSAVYSEAHVASTPKDNKPFLTIALCGSRKGLINRFCHIFNMQALIFRIATVLADRATDSVIYDLINKLKQNPEELKILDDGNQQKPYHFVANCVDRMPYGFHIYKGQLNVFNLGCVLSSNVDYISDIPVK